MSCPLLSAGDPIYEAVGSQEYNVQGLTVTVEAPTQNLYRFIERLSNSMPVMEVAEITIGTPGKRLPLRCSWPSSFRPHPVTEEAGN